ncbi:carbohydrate ABC transporter membrane protein 1 (CUT1 family) [Jatrophihabitans sp. GAS493]|uniref:carbohydrate ABC transporter permease n=1 Tax=Jatrophihabitans sp. GAS493 TaxID=1907575 RepID=UPI000BB8168B|nr:sugar ABC transporter permease [Jatrophihabitans sp. GAS493]SOD73301.1 carbohydrate ABC transporter membrane protein 1 (CUT1 family) [Jatrophihabitans sp. GAS493]
MSTLASQPVLEASLLTDSASKLFTVVLVVGGFIAVMLIIFFIAERAPGRFQRPLAIFICLAPAVILVLIGLVIPAIRTMFLSLHGPDPIGPGAAYVGLKNYKWAITDNATQDTLIRTVLWLIIVPLAATIFGLTVALLVDRMKYQAFPKAMIFMPTAISFVGAAVIWKYVYNYTDPKQPQIGLLSQIVIKLGWHNPPNWLLTSTGLLNTFLLMIIMIWIQTGFAMVVLSAALKAIPDEIVEAARMDGATGFKLFRTVQLPMIRTTMIVVVTTIMIATLKVFDIVYTMTGGQFDTDVLSNDMYNQVFTQFNLGRGSALAVILFLAVLPLVIYNILQMRKDRTGR